MPPGDWQERFADQVTTAREALKAVQPGDHIFIASGCAFPRALVDALRSAGHIRDGHIIHMAAEADEPFAGEWFRRRFTTNHLFASDHSGRLVRRRVGDYTPIYLSEIPHQFETARIPVDVALIMVTPPDDNGLCNLGVSVGINKSAAANAGTVIAQVNERMPTTVGNSHIHISAIDLLVPGNQELPEYEPPPPETTIRKIAENVARLIDDGATLRCGVGALDAALASHLKTKKNLGIHSDIIGDWIIDLVESGCLSGAKKSLNRGKIVTSCCVGTRRLYDYVAGNHRFDFQPSEYVNDPFLIAQHEKMVAVHYGLQVDLTGQTGLRMSDPLFGGTMDNLSDFMRGCARSRGGKAVLALPSTTVDGSQSRVVPQLDRSAGVLSLRGDVHYIVTEYGIAYLHGKSIRQRALSLINIAHPRFRNRLIQSAKSLNYLHEDQIELAWEQVRYPEELEHYDTLRDGTEIFFRPVRPTDEPALAEMLYSLSMDSVSKRYFTATKTFPHRDVQQLTNIDYKNDLAMVGVVPGPSGEKIVAIAQYFLDPKTQIAEVAFIVQDKWQDRGMGSYLMNYIARVAAQRGVRQFYATVLPENRAMLNVFYNSDYNIRTSFDGDSYSLLFDLQKQDVKSAETD